MKKLYFYLILFLILCSGNSYAQCCKNCENQSCNKQDFVDVYEITASGAMSKAHAGHLKIRDGNKWRDKYYYIYVYQYVRIDRGNIRNENHTFSLSGFLGEGDEPNLVGLDESGKYLIYENEYYTLKIPYHNEGKIYFKQRGAYGGWQCISN